jgi:hypothetical protein
VSGTVVIETPETVVLLADAARVTIRVTISPDSARIDVTIRRTTREAPDTSGRKETLAATS